jgi:hypothetical protein
VGGWAGWVSGFGEEQRANAKLGREVTGLPLVLPLLPTMAEDGSSSILGILLPPAVFLKLFFYCAGDYLIGYLPDLASHAF